MKYKICVEGEYSLANEWNEDGCEKEHMPCANTGRTAAMRLSVSAAWTSISQSRLMRNY